MAGHSKWKQIRRQKGVTDARRGQLFTKIAREITVAAKLGGPDPDANFRLRIAVQKARTENMPNDNIKRAIDRATSDAGGDHYDELNYEGFGPSGAGIIVKALTDNRNRTVGEVRAVFTRGGGNLGENGSVSYLFDQIGVVAVKAEGVDADELALAAIDAGAEDFRPVNDDGNLEIVTAPTDVKAVQDALAAAGYEIEDAQITMQPKTTITLDEADTLKVVRLLERLEDLDDVQEVYTNVEISDDVLAQV
ncbi:MAG: YebC/PmpR family DNA-binding transcriptional regulator [Thermomicrobiales bacterium]|jgi:YebC/PmpR family DNA-binding regulatory protein|nr:YebC/PmpR family DNA-binding transcriptional regulator [Thermomicrobiales bacterium]